MLRLCCNYVANMLRLCCDYVATTLRICCECFANIFQIYSEYIANTAISHVFSDYVISLPPSAASRIAFLVFISSISILSYNMVCKIIRLFL